ncbi:tetratricopeptide repeat protein [Candidatus Korobacter versatilis]|uniref:tetratricopeptide repeat protein n=1 Tax=Candidatus Korobacter versatilis TaxID=658062 RepID=UPI0016502467|nr:tetratricopeptide repeat protein [Candidatus Koribacter versatilis]
MKYLWFALLALAFSGAIWAQDDAKAPQNQAPPRSDIESSSNDTRIDTSPPKDDATNHPDSNVDDVLEFHPFDPHKAMKDIEVGDYYFKRENYRGALNRYQEALIYKPNDAEATLRVARTQEKLKEVEDARDNYAAYLKIIHEGKDADEARKAIERLTKEIGEGPKTDSPKQ